LPAVHPASVLSPSDHRDPPAGRAAPCRIAQFGRAPPVARGLL